jgi:hypothetical protein
MNSLIPRFSEYTFSYAPVELADAAAQTDGTVVVFEKIDCSEALLEQRRKIIAQFPVSHLDLSNSCSFSTRL